MTTAQAQVAVRGFAWLLITVGILGMLATLTLGTYLQEHTANTQPGRIAVVAAILVFSWISCAIVIGWGCLLLFS
jgi:hypothetical protein